MQPCIVSEMAGIEVNGASTNAKQGYKAVAQCVNTDMCKEIVASSCGIGRERNSSRGNGVRTRLFL